MKFDDLLAQYLYENKSLQLQGIGTFTLDGAVSLPMAQEKEIYYPIEGLTFLYSPKDLTNEDLIAFLVKKLGKIQPLVRSDLESYLSNIKQFINIGKPYTIEGIGTLQKNNQGTYEFSPGNFLPVKEELSPHRDNPEHLHRQRARNHETGRTGKIVLLVAVVLIVLAGTVWGIIALMKHNSTDVVQDIGPDSTSEANVSRAPDTLTSSSNTVAPVAAISDTSLVDYKMIFDVTRSKDRIFSRSAILKRDGINFKIDTLTINDTLRYRMYIPKKLRVVDTARVKDSLRIFFRKEIIAEARQ